MNAIHRPRRLLVLLLATAMGATTALAAPPPWAGGGKHGGGEEQAVREKGGKPARKPPAPGAYFDDGNRAAVRKYYAANPPKHCPPGLAKKNPGCLPPGQARKWQVGQRLPADVVYAPVPARVTVVLPPVPVGHRYVQVGGDILLIAVGTMMVVDGIDGLLGR